MILVLSIAVLWVMAICLVLSVCAIAKDADVRAARLFSSRELSRRSMVTSP